MTLLSAFTKTSARPDLLILAFTVLACSAFADFSGPFVSVHDGDTIEVLHNRRAERIRPNGARCLNYSQVAPHNRVEFNGAADTEEAGYLPAENCP